jgi:hypothetical protein
MNPIDKVIIYEKGELVEDQVASSPYEQFRVWFEAAKNAGLREPHAMGLATADAGGRPSVRTVLMRGWDERGFAFYTNYESRKGIELDANPRGALLFYWETLERQVRIERRAPRSGGVGRVRLQPSARSSARRVGFGAKSRDIRPRSARRADARVGSAVSGSGSSSAALGRLSRRGRAFRILARAAEPIARPHRLSPRRRALDRRTARTLR